MAPDGGAQPTLMLAHERNFVMDDRLLDWTIRFATLAQSIGFTVELASNVSAEAFASTVSHLKRHGVAVVPTTSTDADSGATDTTPASVTALAELASVRGVRVLFAVGHELSAALGRLERCRGFLWAYCTDDPGAQDSALPPNFPEMFSQVARGARRVVVDSDAFRSTLEANVPSAAGRTLVLPPLSDDFAASAFSALFPALLRSPQRTDSPVARPKTLLVGADFKFADDIVQALFDADSIDFEVLRLKNLWSLNTKTATEAVLSADVVVVEFCSPDAVWLSKHLRTEQKLIVRLHGYELRRPWITELDIDRVHKIALPSQFYLEEAVASQGWPESKLVVLPNGVDLVDLHRPKLDDARFHLAVVGYVPYLKRPDRAVDLLSHLLEHDDRYQLHLKGHSPWNYSFEWEKARNQAAYRAFYESIASSSELKHHVAFEPFSPDMGNWLRKIGWVLSPSARETFHLAPMEGAASGAVPLVWRRQGSTEIYTDSFNFDSTAEIAAFITRTNADRSALLELTDRARSLASRYDSAEIRQRWVDLIHKAHG